MARGVTLWLAVVVLGCAAAFGATGVWTDAVTRSIHGRSRPDSAALVYDSLSRDAARLATTVQRIRWSRALQQRDGDSLILLGPNLPVSAANRAAIREARSRLGPGETVRIAVATARWQRPDDGQTYISYALSQGIDYLLPDTGPCQVVAFVPGGPTTPSILDRLSDPDGFLGPCFWVARYGTPSDSVRAWLRRGGGGVAVSSTPSRPVESPGPEDEPDRRLNRLEIACRQADTGACRSAIDSLATSAPWTWRAPEPYPLLLYSRTSRSPFAGRGAHILADIEAEVGPDRFARFWHAEMPVREAFSEALEEPLGDWIADWARARFPEPRGAGPGMGDILLTLLAVGILVGIGLLLGARGRPVTGL